MDLAFMTFKTSADDPKGKQKDAAADDQADTANLDDSIGLFRLGGAAPLIWQWKASELGAEVAGLDEAFDVRGARLHVWYRPAPAGARIGFAKPSKDDWRIRDVHWSPDGQYLAVVLTFLEAAPESSDALVLLGVHDGLPSAAPLFLSPPSPPKPKSSDHPSTASSAPAERANFICWMPLQPPEPQVADDLADALGGRGDRPFGSDAERAMQFLRQQRARARVATPAEKLIESLPALDKEIPQKGAQAQKGSAGGAAAAVAAALNPSQASSGAVATFTSKAKTMLSIARLPPSLPLPPSTTVHTNVVDSLLVVGTNRGRAHLFLAGTIYLGFVNLDKSTDAPPVAIVAVEALDPEKSSRKEKANGTRLCFLWQELPPGKGQRRLQQGSADLAAVARPRPASAGSDELDPVLVPVPSPAAFENLRLSSLTAPLFSSSIEMFLLAVSNWHEARDLGDRFVAKMQDAIRAHGLLVDARWLLGTLLFTGRPNDALRDFMSTKNTERALSKWTSTMNSSLTELREAIYQVIVPAAERLSIIVNDRREHWFGDPEWRAAESTLGVSHADWLRQGVVSLIEKMYQLEDAVRREHVAFNHLARWLRYEVDVCIHHDSVANHERGAQDLRPWIKHDVLAVDDYLSNRLKLNPLSPLLPRPTLGSSFIPVHLARKDAKPGATSASPKAEETRDKLTGLMDWLLAEPKSRPPSAPSGPPSKSNWADLTPLEHLVGLGYEFGQLFRHAFQRVPGDADGERTAVATTEVCTPEIGSSVRKTRTRVTAGASPARLTAFVGGEARLVVQRADVDPVARTVSATPSVAELPLRVEDRPGEAKLIDFDFFDDNELVLLLVFDGGDDPHRLVTVSLNAVVPPDVPVPTYPHIPVHRSHVLSPQHVPCALALNGRVGRRTGCVLSGEGRSFDVLDLETADGEDDEQAGSVVRGQEDEEMQDA